MQFLFWMALCASMAAAQQVDYVYQVVNTPVRDLRKDGAVCDGTTSVAAAATLAISEGFHSLFLGKNCVWILTTATNWSLPTGPLSIYGEDSRLSIIKTDDPTTKFMGIGANTVLNNIGLQDAFCYGTIPVNVNKTCSQLEYVNFSDQSQTVSAYPYSANGGFVGPSNAIGTPQAITNATNNGSGLIRLTIPGNPFQTNQIIAVRNVGGVTNANHVGANTGKTYPWAVTRIDSSTVDLQNSTFAGSYTSGGTATLSTYDYNAASYLNLSNGGGFYMGCTFYGHCYDAYLQTADTGVHSVGFYGVVSTSSDVGFAGQFINNSTSSDSFTAAVQIQRNAGEGLVISDGGLVGVPNTGNTDITISTGTRTTGAMLNVFQNVSNYNGDLFFATMAPSSGSFTGNYLKFSNAGTLVWQVNSQGQAQLGPVAFASLGTPADGTICYCSNCNSSCTAGGSTGKYCARENGAWVAAF